MKIEILQGGRVLPQYNHEGRLYAEAPPEGDYEIRLTNNHHRRRLAVISVDGVNVINGEDASYDGPGYVLRPWQTVTIPGWRRDDDKVAKFTFTAQDESYATQTGRGTKNTGVIGVAIFDEKEATPLWWNSSNPWGGNSRWPSFHSMDSASDTIPCGATCSTAEAGPVTTLGARTRSVVRELGTGYGKESSFHTATTTFARATEHPSSVLQLQYAVREQLVAWGVPVREERPEVPNAFPASSGPAVPAPPGWSAS